MKFWDQFKAAIYSNIKLNNIDQFNYLMSYLKDEPLDTIWGLTSSSENYARAVDILHDRYGNKQILISSQMDVLVKLQRVASMSDIPNLLEPSVRNLTDLNVEINSYETLLISIIFESSRATRQRNNKRSYCFRWLSKGWSMYIFKWSSSCRTVVIRWACFFIIFVSDGKFDNSTGVRKRTDWNLPHI